MKMNKKGFTLIELLAVIVILAVLLTIAIPAVSNYINSSKKSGYVTNVIQYIDAARNAAINTDYELPSDAGTATVIPFSLLEDKLEKGGKKSPYGNAWTADSFVMIVNEGTNESPRYEYYVHAYDGKYATGYKGADTAAVQQIIAQVDLGNVDVVRITTSALHAPKMDDGFSKEAKSDSNAGKRLVPGGNTIKVTKVEG